MDYKDRVWITGINPNAGREVSTRVDDMILKFTNKGQFLQQIGGRDRSGGNKDTKNPHQSAEVFILPGSNEAFVADGYGNRRVWVIDTETGAFKRMWGAYGKEPNDPPPPAPAPAAGAARGTPPPLETEGPGPNTWGIVHGLKVSNDKMVYVADRANRRLQVFTTEGKYLTQGFVNRGTSRLSCATVLFSPDKEQKYIYCPDFARGEIVVVDRKSLETLAHYGGLGSAPGQMQNVHGAAIDSKGNIYTSEVMPGRRVQKWVYKGVGPARLCSRS